MVDTEIMHTASGAQGLAVPTVLFSGDRRPTIACRLVSSHCHSQGPRLFCWCLFYVFHCFN